MPARELLDTQIKADHKTLGFYIGIAVIGYFVGKVVTENDYSNQIQKLQHDHAQEIRKIYHDYTIGEIGGLRSDWERRNKDVDKKIDELKEFKQ